MLQAKSCHEDAAWPRGLERTFKFPSEDSLWKIPTKQVLKSL